MPIDKRKRSTSAGGKGGGTATSILAAIFGKGGEADANQLVDSPIVPDEYGQEVPLNTYLNNKGQLTSQPFSSGGYNFWDKLTGKQDQATELNNQIVLNSLLGDQNTIQRLREQRGLVPIEAEREQTIGGIKNDLELSRRKQLDPQDIEKTAATSWASKGIRPADASRLSPLTAQQAEGSTQAAIAANNILNSVLNAPTNRQLLEQSTLAREAQPIATLRGGLTRSLGQGESAQYGATGNAFLDKVLSPGIGYGAHKETQMVDLGGGLKYPKEATVPGEFRTAIPVDPTIKNNILSKPNVNPMEGLNLNLQSDDADVRGIQDIINAQSKTATPTQPKSLNQNVSGLTGGVPEGISEGVKALLKYILENTGGNKYIPRQ